MATLAELAQLVDGTVSGDPTATIERLAPIDKAGPGEITFLANPKYLSLLPNCQAAAIIVAPGVEAPGKNLLVCANPYLAFAKILTCLHVPRPACKGVMAGAQVDPSAEIASGVTLYPGCVVGARVKIGAGSILHPGVVLYDGVVVGEESLLHANVVVREGCRLGNRVIVQPGAVIGSDGFGFAPDGEAYYKIPQIGIVVIEDDVEIGSATCIDRAALGVTRIGRGSKIDNLVQVAHNVEIDENTVVVSQVGISGSSRIGKHCTLGGQVGVAGHLRIGDNVTVAARGGVTGNVSGNQILAGFPVIPHKEWLKAASSFNKLPEMRKEISRLKRQLEELSHLIKEEI